MITILSAMRQMIVPIFVSDGYVILFWAEKPR